MMLKNRKQFFICICFYYTIHFINSIQSNLNTYNKCAVTNCYSYFELAPKYTWIDKLSLKKNQNSTFNWEKIMMRKNIDSTKQNWFENKTKKTYFPSKCLVNSNHSIWIHLNRSRITPWIITPCNVTERPNCPQK